MRAATRKPRWYISRGLPVPEAVVLYRVKMLAKKNRRVSTRNALLAAREAACPTT